MNIGSPLTSKEDKYNIINSDFQNGPISIRTEIHLPALQIPQVWPDQGDVPAVFPRAGQIKYKPFNIDF